MDHGQDRRIVQPGNSAETATARREQNGGAGARTEEGYDRGRGRFVHQGGLVGVQGGLGVPGTGKTTLILEKLWPARYVVIYNTAADFGYSPRQKPLPGFQFVHSVATLSDVVVMAKRGGFE